MANWIIVVDDDVSTLKLAGHFLSKAGFRVTALQSGRLALDYVKEHGVPDLFLLDINMPDLDGFHTLDLLKKEMEPGKEVPVAFLTAEERNDQEARGLESGAMDYIRKPFSPEVLVSRVKKILDVQSQMNKIVKTAETDPLTGCLNKAAAEATMTRLCLQETGFLCVLDLDGFKSVNDVFGHDVGDRILVMFAKIIANNLEYPSESGRIGGDEFVVFLRNQKRSEDLSRFSQKINEEYIAGAKLILGDRLNFSIGVSIGAVFVPTYGRDYSELFHLADQSLYIVKRNGKHGCRLYSTSEGQQNQNNKEMDLETITAILEERIEAPSAMWMGREVFGSIYKYMVRYINRYHNCAYRALLTVKAGPELDDARRAEIIVAFKSTIRNSLRNSDVMMECGEHQLFLLLPEVTEYNIEKVINRLMDKWNKSELAAEVTVTTEYAPVHPTTKSPDGKDGNELVVVVDDNPASLKLAEHFLTEQDLDVVTLDSGEKLLELVKERTPNLILLDLIMPDMDGIETFRKLKREMAGKVPPVIILTAVSRPEAESQCLRMGAVDFIQKPFSPEILVLRVQHVLELARLQKNLTEALAHKTQEEE